MDARGGLKGGDGGSHGSAAVSPVGHQIGHGLAAHGDCEPLAFVSCVFRGEDSPTDVHQQPLLEQLIQGASDLPPLLLAQQGIWIHGQCLARDQQKCCTTLSYRYGVNGAPISGWAPKRLPAFALLPPSHSATIRLWSPKPWAATAARNTLRLLTVQGNPLLKLGRLGQHQPPRQIRLHHHQNPSQIEHQPQNQDPAQPIQQLLGTAGIEHLTNRPVRGIGRRSGEHLDPGGELALGVAHGCG